MSDFFEIAYAAANNKLCLFTGTGFSKAITKNEAPNWQVLLESLCALCQKPENLKTALFPEGKTLLNLEEAAQVIAIELQKVDKNIHEEIAKIIASLELKGDNSIISDFLAKQKSLAVLTTNYDKLFEALVEEKNCLSLSPGFPVPRSESRVNIYHVHGSIDSAVNMVVTANDYFNFINKESYFSRKLSTILHENTVVILGYSLGDTNLKAILSDYNGFSRNYLISSNIFLVSRSKVNQYIKDYYSHCYGIRVLDNLEVHDFFRQLNTALPEAEKNAKESISNIKKVINEKRNFKEEYLKMENSFYQIVSSVAAIGKSINDARVVEVLGNIVEAKTVLTNHTGAWDQYVQLANWLIYLGSSLEIKGTTIEKIYLDAVLRSMNTMRKTYYHGYSWHAFTSWNNGWQRMTASNRALIRTHISKNTEWADALEVVNREF